jgi:hypothetical protein
MKLLAADSFEPIFEPLLGRPVSYVPTAGGPSDRLVEMAALQLFAHFGVDYLIETLGDRTDRSSGPEVSQIVLPGGNSGPIWSPAGTERIRALAEAIPVTLLPRSLAGPVGLRLRRGHVRERASLAWEPSGIVVPDLILGLEVTPPPEATDAEGIWLRRDAEALFADRESSGDPELSCTTATEYLALAARFRSVVTDRPEFAMAAMVQGRKATLLPSASPVNRSLFETWLRDLGCGWRETPDAGSESPRVVVSTPAPPVAPPPPQPAIALPSAGCDPVFVIGSPRSGTTALGKALARHSRFYAGDETIFLIDLFGGRRAEEIHERWAGRPSSSWLRREQVSREQFLAALGSGLNALLTKAGDGRRWVDHTPAHAMMAETLAGLFPTARFLHILRDGREVVNSMRNVPNTLPGDLAERMQQAEFLPEWTRDFRAACETWLWHVQAATEFERMYPDRCLTVRHRELEADPAAEMTRIFRFLEVPVEDRAADFLHRGRRINSSFTPPGGCRADEYRRPDPLATWTDEERATFLELCGAEMRSLGLDRESGVPSA